ARLVALAKDAKRCLLDNGNVPQLPSLSEPDTAEMETFLEEMLLICPLLGLSIFEKPRDVPPTQTILYLRSKGAEARGYDAPEGFVVLAGSQAIAQHVASIHRYMLTLRNSLVEQGVLVRDGDFLRLAQNYTFESPSTAAGVMMGRTANGRIEWKDEHGTTLKEIQARSIGEDASEASG